MPRPVVYCVTIGYQLAKLPTQTHREATIRHPLLPLLLPKKHHFEIQEKVSGTLKTFRSPVVKNKTPKLNRKWTLWWRYR